MQAQSQNLLANIRIVLARPSHPGNIGAAARAMKTMGLTDLWLVSPRAFPHPDAEAMASGAVDLLLNATVCDTLEAALAGCVLAIAQDQTLVALDRNAGTVSARLRLDGAPRRDQDRGRTLFP